VTREAESFQAIAAEPFPRFILEVLYRRNIILKV